MEEVDPDDAREREPRPRRPRIMRMRRMMSRFSTVNRFACVFNAGILYLDLLYFVRVYIFNFTATYFDMTLTGLLSFKNVDEC
jgi:hypothetical protein